MPSPVKSQKGKKRSRKWDIQMDLCNYENFESGPSSHKSLRKLPGRRCQSESVEPHFATDFAGKKDLTDTFDWKEYQTESSSPSPSSDTSDRPTQSNSKLSRGNRSDGNANGEDVSPVWEKSKNATKGKLAIKIRNSRSKTRPLELQDSNFLLNEEDEAIVSINQLQIQDDEIPIELQLQEKDEIPITLQIQEEGVQFREKDFFDWLLSKTAKSSAAAQFLFVDILRRPNIFLIWENEFQQIKNNKYLMENYSVEDLFAQLLRSLKAIVESELRELTSRYHEVLNIIN